MALNNGVRCPLPMIRCPAHPQDCYADHPVPLLCRLPFPYVPLAVDLHFTYSFFMASHSSSTPGVHRPSFLWDYDLSATEVHALLAHQELTPVKRWLMERLLTEGRFEDVCAYLDLTTIRQSFDQLRLPPHIKARWAYALKRWTAA
ncbi:MAG: hypothetical protein ACRERD_26705 [Candidatus Binatia bacterium]